MLTDFTIGLITGILLYQLPGTETAIIPLSLLFSILPDLDFLIYHAKHPIDRFSHKHRRILHLPLPYILIGAPILAITDASITTCLSFIILSLWHFIHDTYSLGYGVQWLSPFTPKHYFWSQNPIPTSRKVFSKLHSDTPENVDAHANKNGDDNWLKKPQSLL